ncbi:hypothetical protein C8Q74DRAFT_1371360 [Fomes fomentarius]|nr:hypothetical protein C8Q74DRAFT_1371360 [Fomes fomentarius]
MLVLVHSLIAVAALLPVSAWAAIDWEQPCHSGTCHWDTSNEHGVGLLTINGSISSISDLTPAAGWTVLDCDSDSREQVLRVVCHDPSKGCDHLYLNGAEHTFVRLPKECGSNLFAFVTHSWHHEDQSIHAKKRGALLPRYDRSPPAVKGIRLSSNYSQLDPTRHGPVRLLIRGYSGSGDGSPIDVPDGNELSVLQPKKTGKTDPRWFECEASQELFSWNYGCPQSGSTPAYSGEVKVDFNTKVNGSLAFGYEIDATLFSVPPEINNFTAFVDLNATFKGTLDLAATLTASLSSGRIELAAIDIPGWGAPPLYEVGPSLHLYAEADAILSTELDLTVGMEYTVSNARLSFPSVGDTRGTIHPSGSDIKLSASPDITADAQISLHLIPTLTLGVSLIDNEFSTSLNLELDASTTLDLRASAEADASISQGQDSRNETSTGWEGCVEVSTGFSVEGIAETGLAQVWDKDASVTLYNNTWDLYTHCVGGSASSHQRRAYIDLGEAAMSSYLDSVLSKYAKNRGTAPNPSMLIRPDASNTQASGNKPSTSFSCLPNGPGNISPVLQRVLNGSR